MSKEPNYESHTTVIEITALLTKYIKLKVAL